MTVALPYPSPVPKKPHLVTVKEASKVIDVHEMTVWRWLRAGLIERYKSKPGAPKVTKVDLNEVRALKESPPVRPT